MEATYRFFLTTLGRTDYSLYKGKNKIDMIIVDEIHTCKSPTSQQGKNLLKLKTAMGINYFN